MTVERSGLGTLVGLLRQDKSMLRFPLQLGSLATELPHYVLKDVLVSGQRTNFTCTAAATCTCSGHHLRLGCLADREPRRSRFAAVGFAAFYGFTTETRSREDGLRSSGILSRQLQALHHCVGREIAVVLDWRLDSFTRGALHHTPWLQDPTSPMGDRSKLRFPSRSVLSG